MYLIKKEIKAEDLEAFFDDSSEAEAEFEQNAEKFVKLDENGNPTGTFKLMVTWEDV